MRWGVTIEDSECKYTFPKNTSYHLLGLFHTYFTHHASMPIREAFEVIFPQNPEPFDYRVDKLQLKMIQLGLEIVQQTVAGAMFYGCEKLQHYSPDLTLSSAISSLQKKIEKEEDRKTKEKAQFDPDGYYIFTDNEDDAANMGTTIIPAEEPMSLPIGDTN
jgi:hypothetical protein